MMGLVAQPVLEADFLIDALREIVGDAHAFAGEEAPGMLEDQLGRYKGRARAIVRPGSTQEVAETVAFLAARNIPIVTQGGNTGLVGGATPDASGTAVLLSLSRMNRIISIDADNDAITLEAGVLLADAQAAALEAGRWFPLSLPSEGSCTIGGNLGTNAGGTQVLRFGSMRALTLGIEVVTAEGEIWNGLRGLRKDNAGYDLKDLFIGSEGTLGVITAATLRLFPPPASRQTAFLRVAGDRSLLDLLGAARAGFGPSLTGFEIISASLYRLVAERAPEYRLPFPSLPEDGVWHVLIETAGENDEEQAQDQMERIIGEALENRLAEDALIAQSLTQREEFWNLREQALGLAQRRDGWNAKHDVSLPISLIPKFMRSARSLLESAFPGIRIFAHGHAGDGNIHYHVARPLGSDDDFWDRNEAEIRALVHDSVTALGGSISAEHGVGQSKKEALPRYKPAVEIALMRKIKQALDPKSILNPGKVLSA